MTFTLPPLSYNHNALEPYIEERTVRIHHDQYHSAYVDRLNSGLNGTEWQGRPIEELLVNLETIPGDTRRVVRNMGGGHYNHSLYFSGLSPTGGGEPQGKLASAIVAKFGTFENFKDAFTQVGARELFGAGWAWLVHTVGGVEVMSTANQENPLSFGKTPILGIDVWEHAYYPQYLSRKDYFEAFWHLVNWSEIESRFSAAATRQWSL